MENIHIWLVAALIVEITIIAMFACYVMLQFFDLNKYRSHITKREEKLKERADEINRELTKIHEVFGSFIEEWKINSQIIMENEAKLANIIRGLSKRENN